MQKACQVLEKNGCRTNKELKSELYYSTLCHVMFQALHYYTVYFVPCIPRHTDKHCTTLLRLLVFVTSTNKDVLPLCVCVCVCDVTKRWRRGGHEVAE